ncbi:MAG: HigA family addiction module antitoxin [Candidatus Uhrbacteria bacterium]
MAKLIRPIHPGEVLKEEFLVPFDLSEYRLAKEISVPARRINEVVHGTRGVSADTALRLARYFGTSAELWLNLQSQYELAIETDRGAKKIEREVLVFAMA